MKHQRMLTLLSILIINTTSIATDDITRNLSESLLKIERSIQAIQNNLNNNNIAIANLNNTFANNFNVTPAVYFELAGHSFDDPVPITITNGFGYKRYDKDVDPVAYTIKIQFIGISGSTPESMNGLLLVTAYDSSGEAYSSTGNTTTASIINGEVPFTALISTGSNITNITIVSIAAGYIGLWTPA